MSRALRWILPILSLAISEAAWARPDQHLFEGARQFRAGNFEPALIEFKIASKLEPRGEAVWYVAATLSKLGRAEEALDVFLEAAEIAPDARDALLDYYRALACYEQKLYLSADQLLASVEREAGPQIAAQAKKIRGDIAASFGGAIEQSTIAWYRARGQEASSSGKARRALAFEREAQTLAERQPRPEARAAQEVQ